MSFNRRRSRGECVGGDYGTLRTDYSAPTFGRGRRHHQDSMHRLALVDISVSAMEATRRRELVLLVSLALGELTPRHAGHAVRPSQYAVAVPQYGVVSF